MKDTHPSREMLAAFDRGLLPPPDQTEVEQHVAGCTSCCHTLEYLGDDELVALLKSSAVTPVASPSTIYGGSARADTPAGNGTADPQIPAPLIDHPRYRIVGLLGAGGMGAVFQAEHRLMERAVALKVLNPELVQRPGAVLRFRQEMKAASQLSHPNIVTAYDADQAGDVHFLVMELVEGKSLDQQIDPARPLAFATACSWACQAAQGLQHAHERGMVHRDIKPGNLMVVENRETGVDLRSSIFDPRSSIIKILDFGLARFASEVAAIHLTASGALVGTPDYVAPEQARDPRTADIRADIYSLGCTLYQLLTGQVPHPGGTVLQKLMAHQEAPPRPMTDFRRDLPPGLVAVVQRMMAKDPNQRYQTPAEVIAALAPFTAQPAVSATGAARRPRPRLVMLLSLAMVLGAMGLMIAGLAYWGSEPNRPLSAQMTEPATFVVVQPTVPQPPPTQPQTRPSVPQTRLVVPENKQARDAAVAWLRTHNNFADSARFVEGLAGKIDKELARCSMMQLTVGPGLLTAKKPVVLAIRDGQFHSFELLPEEVKETAARTVSTLALDYPPDPRRLPEAVQLAGVTLQASRIPLRESIRGTVHYRIVEDVREKYTLRISTFSNGHRWTIFKKLNSSEVAQGSCNFVVTTNDLSGEITGPVLLYAEAGVEVKVKDGRPVGMTVVSNTLATIAHVEVPVIVEPEN